MTQSNLRYFLAAISLLGNGTFAFAQSPGRPHPVAHPRPGAHARAVAPKPVATNPPATSPAAVPVLAPAAAPLTNIGTSAVVAAPTPYVDPHPYQSQVSVRVTADGIQNGMFEVLPAFVMKEYKYRVPGMPLQTAQNTVLMYDIQNPLPAVTVSGANYSFYEGGYLSTLDANGSFNYRGKVQFSPAVIGGVYFTDKETNNIYTVDSFGFYMNTNVQAPKIKVAGGNYFISDAGLLTTIRSMGKAPLDPLGMVTQMNGFNFSDVSQAGGNFFVKSSGLVTTIDSITGFFKDNWKTDSEPKILGGNYFIGKDDRLYTVAANGNIDKPDNFTLSDSPSVIGYSFMKFPNGRMVVVDGEGTPHDSLVRVSSSGLKAEVVKSLPDALDPKTIYLPNLQQ